MSKEIRTQYGTPCRPGTFADIASIQEANKSIGHHFFDENTLSFFDIYPDIYGGSIFVTSEKDGDNFHRRYTVRYALPDGKIETIGNFQGFKSFSGACVFAHMIAEGF